MYGQFLIYLEPGGEMLPRKNWQLGAWFQIYTELEIYLLYTFTIQKINLKLKDPMGMPVAWPHPLVPPKTPQFFMKNETFLHMLGSKLPLVPCGRGTQ